MTQDYPKPIAPPPEVIGEWWIAWDALDESERPRLEDFIADRASQYGADQELEACVQTLKDQSWYNVADDLRAARRPKPPSLKERALKILEEEPEADDMAELIVFDTYQVNIIRLALEQLDD